MEKAMGCEIDGQDNAAKRDRTRLRWGGRDEEGLAIGNEKRRDHMEKR